MSTTRRTFMQAVLATVLAVPLSVMAAGSEAGRIEYKGADDLGAFNAKLAEVSRNNVTANVFHATWCGPCKHLFKQLATMQKEADFSVLAVDTEKYPNITKASLPFAATPQMHIYVDGDAAHYFAGYLQNEQEVARFIRDLNKVLRGESSPVVAPRP